MNPTDDTTPDDDYDEVEAPARPDFEVDVVDSQTFVPIDRRLINADRISKQELRWLNAYHARVRDEIRPLVDEATKVWLDAATAPMAYTD